MGQAPGLGVGILTPMGWPDVVNVLAPVVALVIAVLATADSRRSKARAHMLKRSTQTWMRPRVGTRAAIMAIPGVLDCELLVPGIVRVKVAWWASKKDVREWLDTVCSLSMRVELRRSLK